MVNIFFIHRFPFNKEAYIRDEFEFFISRGHDVKYLEISYLLKKKNLGNICPKSLKEHVISFGNKKDFSEFLMDHKDNSIIITDVGLLANSAWMYLAIFKSRIPYVLFENSVLPNIKSKSVVGVNKVGFLKFFRRFNYSKIYIKPFEVFQYYKAVLALIPAKMIITSKSKLSSEKIALKGKNSIMKYSMSLDYKMAETVSKEPFIDQKYVVFIDQFFVHHPDFKTNHIVHSFTADQYYTELNNFLAYFLSQTGLKVVIAAHPRRSKEQMKDFYPEFEIFCNKTAELIKNSEMVFLHFSTAINFAVIFNKPFVLLNSSLFHNSSIYESLMMFSNFFRKEPVDMRSVNSKLSLNELLCINENKYQEFLDQYIKHPKATNETFKDMVLEIIKSM